MTSKLNNNTEATAHADVNRQLLLAARPNGVPDESHFEYRISDVPKLSDGEFLVRNRWISLDPAMRGWMSSGKSYIPPVEVGEVMRAFSAGHVVSSKHSEFKVGMQVAGVFGLQDYAVSKGEYVRAACPGVKLEEMLGPVGLPGITAYFGLLDIGKPKANETVVVSAAAGAVGSIVVQIAKRKGCRVVGIAGTPEKCAFVKELGADSVINYKADDYWQQFKAAVPNGCDVYFDNVGGVTLEYALRKLNVSGRIVLCGAISHYNAASITGPAAYLSLLSNRARMEGFVYFDYVDQFDEAEMELAAWVRDGSLKYGFHIEQGLLRAPEVLAKLFSGANTGKLLIEVEQAEAGDA